MKSRSLKRKIGSPKKPRPPVKRKVSNITNLKIGDENEVEDQRGSKACKILSSLDLVSGPNRKNKVWQNHKFINQIKVSTK